MADKVFEDRLGVYIITPSNLGARLPTLIAAGVRDVFLPRTAERSDLERVRAAGGYAHLWVAVHDRTPAQLAADTLADITRLGPGACELNIELPSDPPLAGYIREVVTRIRAKRPNYRLRINTAPWKAFALPVDLLTSDANLYACEQNYEGNMDNLLSAGDVLEDMLDWGVPRDKATVCYAAACRVAGSAGRIATLPDLSRRRRGVIFSDDLLADAGLL